MEERVFSSRESDLKALKKRFKNLSYIAAILCSLGLATCFYALRIEIIKSKDSSYSAFCDINSYISCTKVFFSKYGKGFGLLPEGSIFNQPNTVYGILFFSSQMILLLFNRKALMIDAKLFLSILANLGNVYLAYILYFVLRDFCLVCVAFYLINFFLLIINHKHYMCKNKILRLLSAKKKKSN